MAKFYLAPLRGITDSVFRKAYERRFGRFDRIVAPFISIILGNRIRDHHVRDLLADKGSVRLIPQIIGSEAEGFLLLCRRFADLGFTSVNWNLGCPAPLVARKTRGCGLLPHTDAIKRFLDDVTPRLPVPLSIKTRLGYESPSELEALIPVFNSYPLKELIIHPRIGTQLYDGTVNLDGFETYLNMSKHPVVYNGDIISVGAFKRLADRFPDVSGWMVGRGVVRNPFLLGELRKYADGAASTAPAEQPPSAEELQLIIGFLNDIINACKDRAHPINILGRMKELWKYLGDGIDGWGDLSNKVLKCASLQEYTALTAPFAKT